MRAASEAVLQRGGESLGRGWRAARQTALRLAGVRPLYVVAPVVALQLVAVLVLALRVPHNGWLYSNGGDATTYWLSEWAIAHGYLPTTWLGYGLPVAFGWVPLLGTTLLEGLPAIVLVQVLVLLPLATVLVYALARRIAGPLFAAFAVVVWAAAPFATLELLRADYRERFEQIFLPQALGLVNMGDFPSLVVLLAAAYLVFRVIDEGRGEDALLAGLLIGFAVGIKPSNALMLPLPAVAFALRRYWRSILLYALALVPALLTLAIWKQRGLGELPALSLPDFDLAHFNDNMHAVREYSWSRLLVEYLPIAGAFAAIRKSTAKGVYLALWVVVYFVVQGGTPAADVWETSYFRLSIAGLPAYALLATAVVLLVPRWGVRAPVARARETLPRLRPHLGIAVALLAVAPLAVVAFVRPAPPETLAFQGEGTSGAPISSELDVGLVPASSGVRLTWTAPDTGSSDVFYAVYRGAAADGDGCAEPAASRPQTCSFSLPLHARTAATHFEDAAPPSRYVYRVGVFAGAPGRPEQAALVLLSPPVVGTVGSG